jgi:hypothetical protein
VVLVRINACKSLKKNVIFREKTGVKKTKHLITPLIIAIAISLFPALTTGMAVADTVEGKEPLDGGFYPVEKPGPDDSHNTTHRRREQPGISVTRNSKRF